MQYSALIPSAHAITNLSRVQPTQIYVHVHFESSVATVINGGLMAKKGMP